MPFISLIPPIYTNVKQYGALGDGTTDDTTAIAATFAALPAAGGVVFFPPGDYKITSTIAFTFGANQDVVIEGAGNARLVSTIAEPGGEDGILRFTGDAGITARLTIRNLIISHTNSGLGLLDGIFVQPLNYGSGGTQSVANLELDNVRITGASKFGARILGAIGGIVSNCRMNTNRDSGLALTGCLDMTVIGGDYSSNVSGSLAGDYGITLASSSFLPACKNILISGVQANSNGRKGIDVHHGHNVHIIGNTCIGNGYVGIYAVMEDTTKDVGDITIMGNTIDQTGGNNTLVNNGVQIGTFGTTGTLTPGSFIVSGNKIFGVDAGTTASNAIAITTATTGVPPDRIIISNNTIKNGAGSAGYVIEHTGTLVISYLEITGNVLHAVSCTAGVWIQQATDIIVNANDLRIDSGTPNYGFLLVASANSTVVGNQINGVALTSLPISTSSTTLARANTRNGVALVDTAFLAPFTIASTLTIDAFGHVLALPSGAPTLSAVNANVANQVLAGNDVRGSITFDVITGTLAAGSTLFTVTFTNAYGSA